MKLTFLDSIGRWLARYLSRPSKGYTPIATHNLEVLTTTLQPGDVLLVEGPNRISTAIKFLTQSTWSHSAIYVGDAVANSSTDDEVNTLVEADVVEGVRALPLSKYSGSHTRICRPVGLKEEEMQKVIGHVVSRLGHKYDLKNVFDLARYLIRTPPVLPRWRRRMLALGSGDPTRAICSSLIAEAFQSVQYPILPEVIVAKATDSASVAAYKEYLHIRHHSLFTPRDFDLSPYFQVIKPTIEANFDFHSLSWCNDECDDDTANA